ncbi:MAG: phage terminase large subunit, partial [Bryobacteraceae bacterium]
YWDLKLSDSMDGSWVVGQVWGRAGGDVFLLDQERFRGGFVETLDRIARLRERWPKASPIYIEEAAAGPAVIEVAKKRWPDVIGDRPKGSKVQRAEAVAPMFEAGSVRLPPRGVAPWIDEYREELAMFPRSRFDDQVDATSGALGVLRNVKKEIPLAMPWSLECEDWTSMGGGHTRWPPP